MQTIKFTDPAIEHIKNVVAKKTNAIGFRLSVKKTGCSGYSYTPEIIETVSDNDIHFAAENRVNIYLDKNSLQFFANLTVDFVVKEDKGLKQKRLVFINPHEKSRCGCGESFHV